VLGLRPSVLLMNLHYLSKNKLFFLFLIMLFPLGIRVKVLS
jgi:hypothetical protein